MVDTCPKVMWRAILSMRYDVFLSRFWRVSIRCAHVPVYRGQTVWVIGVVSMEILHETRVGNVKTLPSIRRCSKIFWENTNTVKNFCRKILLQKSILYLNLSYTFLTYICFWILQKSILPSSACFSFPWRTLAVRFQFQSRKSMRK